MVTATNAAMTIQSFHEPTSSQKFSAEAPMTNRASTTSQRMARLLVGNATCYGEGAYTYFQGTPQRSPATVGDYGSMMAWR